MANEGPIAQNCISWDAPAGFLPPQKFPRQTLPYLSNKYLDDTIYERYKLLAALKCSLKWCERCYGMDLHTLPAIDCAGTVVMLKKSMTKHSPTGCVFSSHESLVVEGCWVYNG